VVRATGGLADSITDYDGSSLTNGTATGFVFEEYTATAMMGAIHRAIACFGNQTAWLSLVHNGMQKDFSWNSSARQYEDLYAKLVPRE
jgi:starch synthase